MNRQELLENDEDFYYDAKNKKLYITTEFYDDIIRIINTSRCIRDMIKELQYTYAIINERLVYKIIDSVRLGYKSLIIL